MKERISIVGGGAIGFTLAASLQSEGRQVVVYRVTAQNSSSKRSRIIVKLQDGTKLVEEIATERLAPTTTLNGSVIVTAKAFGNSKIAEMMSSYKEKLDLVLLQNGIGVEAPFLGKNFKSISRCVVYITAERLESGEFTARMVKPSPIGILEQNGSTEPGLAKSISTGQFKFYEEKDILKEVWMKGIINTVFNSICPLLDIDNGIFIRDSGVLALAKDIVHECVPVAETLGISLTADEIIEQIKAISLRSNGQLISTLQDLRARRETEIQYFNMAICRIASSVKPPQKLAKTELLGFLIEKKSKLESEKINRLD